MADAPGLTPAPATEPEYAAPEPAQFPPRPATAPVRPDLPRPSHPVTFGRVPFAHPAEEEFARLLDFFRVAWDYEPTSFPLRWDGDRVTEMFTPDFYLPEQDLYVELTTMKQSLIQRKHRKLRRIREVYPEINIVLLTRRDYYELLSRFGYGAVDITSLPEADIDRILYSPAEIATRVAVLGAQISADYAGRSILLVGLLKGVTFFLADLARAITRPVAIDYLSVASLNAGGEVEGGSGVHFSKDADFDYTGQHVLLLEDIVNTGLTLDFVVTRLWERQPASLEVCVLFDKRERRLIDAPVKYTGFTIPNAYVVGYGLDYQERYRNLPFLCVLKQDVFHREHGARLAEINNGGSPGGTSANPSPTGGTPTDGIPTDG